MGHFHVCKQSSSKLILGLCIIQILDYFPSKLQSSKYYMTFRMFLPLRRKWLVKVEAREE